MAKRGRKPKSVTPENATKFGYDAVDTTKKKRRVTASAIYAEDDELPSYKRVRLISGTRDLQRNFTAAGWAIRKHLDYVSTFNFQVRTQDQTFNKRLESLFKWWSMPENCDIAGRHSLNRFIRIAEQARAIDGDVLVIFVKEGYLQAIESDRIVSESGSNTTNTSGSNIINGVKVDANGRALQYGVGNRRSGSGSVSFEKWIDAKYSHLLGYFDRFDQVRGISRMAPAINTFQDLYEGIDYALAKSKVAQLFGLITYRDASDPLGSYSENEYEPTEYDIKFGSGPFHLALDGGDKAEVLESKTPSTEFQAFAQTMIALAMKSLDIPFSFYDESFTNYSGARQALLQYEQSVKSKREDLVALLNKITIWKITQWIASGLIALPSGYQIRDLEFEWIPNGLPWIDPQKEISADVMAINNKLKSRQQVCKERGKDFFETVDQLKAEEDYMNQIGISATVATDGVVENDQQKDEEMENADKADSRASA